VRILLSFPNVNLRGGVERVLCECANYLAAHQHSVSVLACTVETGALRADVVHIPVATSRFGVPLGRFACNASESYQTLEVHPNVHGAFCTASPPGGVLWVQAVHRTWIDIARKSRNFTGRLKQRLNPFHGVALRLEQSMIGERRYAKLIALTSAVADDLKHYYDIPGADIEVLPNGVNCVEFKNADAAEKQAARAELGVPSDARVVLFVANEADRKGFVPLLEAVSALPDRDVHVLAVGRLGGLKTWATALGRLGLNGKVTFTGPTSNVAIAYKAADVFALPTIYEAWGLVIVEALASGIPVLTSRLAGAGEAVQEGETGDLLDNPHDVTEIRSKLSQLLAGKHTDAAAISASVQKYDWSNILSQYEQILADSRFASH
jgi:UDP-glucose:(heptosyl)LPS alpha-1,3-glucosyltransferase